MVSASGQTWLSVYTFGGKNFHASFPVYSLLFKKEKTSSGKHLAMMRPGSNGERRVSGLNDTSVLHSQSFLSVFFFTIGQTARWRDARTAKMPMSAMFRS